MHNILKYCLLGSVSLFGLTACIQDEGRSATDDTPVLNVPPEFEGEGAALFLENQSGVVFTARASDRNGDQIVYGISGGTDAERFRIDSRSGEVSFNLPPDYERPQDADGNNLYQVSLAAFDGQGGQGAQTLNVTVTNDMNETRYQNTLFRETTISSDISYAIISDQPLQLNIVTANADTATNRPAIILASGGGFLTTEKLDVADIAANFARAGYVAIIMDYRTLEDRGITAATSAEQLALAAIDATHDMAAVIRYIRANASTYGINPDQVIVGGASAGAIMGATLITSDPNDTFAPFIQSYLDANGGLYGNVGQITDQSSVPQAGFIIAGGILDLTHIDTNSLPFFAAHEQRDPIVPCQTGAEGSSGTGLILSGSCAMIADYNTLNIAAEVYMTNTSIRHIDFTPQEYYDIFNSAIDFYYTNVLNQTG